MLQFEKEIESPAERAKRLGVRLLPVLPDKPERAPGTNPVVAVCGLCGIEIRNMMMMACNKTNCPAGLGPARYLKKDNHVAFQIKDNLE